MNCPKCGYNLQPWDTQCPRCAMQGQQQPVYQPPGQQPLPGAYPQSGGYAPPGAYQQPGAYPQPPQQIQPAWFQTLHTFVSPAGLTTALTIVLGIGLVVDAISVISDIMQANLLSVAAGGGQVGESDAMANDARQALIGLAILGSYIVSVIIWCIWVNRVHKNSMAFGSKVRRFTTGWAVGWYFVPFMNLVRPWEAMKEIWQASDPDVPNVRGTEWQGAVVPSIVGWWWGVFLIANAVTNVSTRMTLGANKSASEMMAGSWASAVGAVLQVVAGIVAIVMIRGLASRQEDTYSRLYHQTYQQPQAAPNVVRY